ncbi:RNA-binding S4 domain-containing protein [Colwellia sp. E2M01]|uniref:RNA-binding S4 domain-containing protein n=1 Tax=Colwellia sp. E2M01 TaxID=2841561 RepID=UPI001C0874EF|nr:RNA-binding S4 domain-containing protein [Colwellia sp. E2M01]MBU2871374.1 RNA-binding S4 domain-containing protein [Colwellia sp. E2M01]
MSDSYIEVELTQQPVELCKLLKIADLVSGGGEAKVVISEGYVLLNGEVEYQKRKKIYHEDIIEFNGEIIQLIINEAQSEEMTQDKIKIAPKNITPPKHKQSLASKNNAKPTKKTESEAKLSTQPTPSTPRKRKPISF